MILRRKHDIHTRRRLRATTHCGIVIGLHAILYELSILQLPGLSISLGIVDERSGVEGARVRRIVYTPVGHPAEVLDIGRVQWRDANPIMCCHAGPTCQ